MDHHSGLPGAPTSHDRGTHPPAPLGQARQSPYPVASGPPASRRKPKRPGFGLIIAAFVAYRVAFSKQWVDGPVGAILPYVLLGGLWAGLFVWRMVVRARVRRNGVESDPVAVRRQIAESGVAEPAFAEDGSLLGASILVVNQTTKLLEVITSYDIHGSDGRLLGHVRQVGQGRWKRFFRIVSSFDQFFTHRFEVRDHAGGLVLTIVRPAKVFLSKVQVSDHWGRPLGHLQQQNVLGKIRFLITGADGLHYGVLAAENLRAWDFAVQASNGAEVASVTKTWEGWLRTAGSQSDHYVIRVHYPLPEPMRSLTFAAAFAVDLALKQDARGLGRV